MSIFDRLKNVAEKTAKDAARSVGNTIGTKRETFTFSALPESLAEMQALPEAKLDTPFATAALTVLALCAYAADLSLIVPRARRAACALRICSGQVHRHGNAELAARPAPAQRSGYFFS